jgi:hypothetical protein
MCTRKASMSIKNISHKKGRSIYKEKLTREVCLSTKNKLHEKRRSIHKEKREKSVYPLKKNLHVKSLSIHKENLTWQKSVYPSIHGHVLKHNLTHRLSCVWNGLYSNRQPSGHPPNNKISGTAVTSMYILSGTNGHGSSSFCHWWCPEWRRKTLSCSVTFGD